MDEKSRMAPFWVALVACCLGGFALLGHRYLPLTLVCQQANDSIPYPFADSEYYVAIAQGHISQVQSPYSKRVLFSMLAAGVADACHISLPLAFVDLNFLAFILLAYFLAATLSKLNVNVWWTVLALSTPLALESLQRAYLPDLFHMMLVALFFLLLVHNREPWALAVLFLAFLTRDNTVLLALALCLTAWLTRKRFLLKGSFLVLITGLVCDFWFVRLGQPNRHHMPELLYMAEFVPCSFLGNVFGLVFWTNVGGADGQPLFHWHIPHFLQFGADHEVYMRFNSDRCFETFGALLTLFGTGPLLIFWWWKDFLGLVRKTLVVQLAFYYGIVSYFLGTSLGRTGAFRLIGYSYPLFWISLPCLLMMLGVKMSRSQAAFLVAASLLVAWTPNLDGLTGSSRHVGWTLVLIPILYFGTVLCLRHSLPRRA